MIWKTMQVDNMVRVDCEELRLSYLERNKNVETNRLKARERALHIDPQAVFEPWTSTCLS